MGGPGSGPRRSKHSTDRGYRDWYQLERWRRLARRQLHLEPLCAHCMDRGVVRPAVLVDHIEPHGGDWMKFITGALQSLCADCHNRHKQREELRGYSSEIDGNGLPIDPRHPANRGGEVKPPRVIRRRMTLSPKPFA